MDASQKYANKEDFNNRYKSETSELASCLIYARAFIEYVRGCVLFQYVTVREIRGR